jgi:hypothetical protein
VRSGSLRLPTSSIGALAAGALAAGSLAVGALAIGALAVGRLAIRRARIGTLEIGELNIRQARGGAFTRLDGQPGDEVATTAAVAEAYVSLCRQGEFDGAMERFFSPGHIRIEPMNGVGSPAEIRGLEAIRQNSRQFSSNHEIHRVEIDGPFVGADRFAVRFTMEVTFRRSGRRGTIQKMDLYAVQDGKVVRSEVYYNALES